MSEPPPIPVRRFFGLPTRRLLLIGLVLVGFLLALRFTGALRAFRIPSAAMSPTLSPGDNILCEGVSIWLKRYQNGDVVVFTTAGIHALPGMIGAQPQDFIKRLAGLPGDKVQLVDGMIVINGITPAGLTGRRYLNMNHFFDREVVVPEGQCLVLGDNSGNSLDSRYFGFVPVGNLHSRYLMRFIHTSDKSGEGEPQRGGLR